MKSMISKSKFAIGGRAISPCGQIVLGFRGFEKGHRVFFLQY
ncbi:hypothetical protein [Acidaminobacterium chupaoyuni]